MECGATMSGSGARLRKASQFGWRTTGTYLAELVPLGAQDLSNHTESGELELEMA